MLTSRRVVSTGSSANSSSNSDRLQERLARAIAAKKYAAQKPDSHASSSNVPSRVGSPSITGLTPRRSTDNPPIDGDSEDGTEDQHQKEHGNAGTLGPTKESLITTTSTDTKANDSGNGLAPTTTSEVSPRPSMDSNLSSASKPSIDSPGLGAGLMVTVQDNSTTLAGPVGEDIGHVATENDPSILMQQSDMSASDLYRQEEIHGYIERIDALQAKLQYLSRESAESARKAALASPGSVEKKLAEKDQQIALLMEEGQKLSKTELKHMTIIKKLRSKSSEAEKETTEAKRRLEKADKEKVLLLERLKRAEATEKLSAERSRILAQAQKDIEAVTTERDAKDSVIAELKAKLEESTLQVNAHEVKATQEMLVMERRRVAELENDVSSLRIEKELATARAKAQLEELRTKMERDAERARVAEVEMRAEQQMLESRLEVMRTRAEEVSSGSTGDAQAKFLRQIETLQTQYAVASDNWKGIETTLTARVTSLEKERDEALRRENDVKRKAREVVSQNRMTLDLLFLLILD